MGKARWYTKPSVLQPDTLKYNPNLLHGGINSPDRIKITRIVTHAEIHKCNIFLRTPCMCIYIYIYINV